VNTGANIGEGIDTIVRCWRALLLESQGTAIDYGRDVISKGKSSTMAPPDYGSAAERIKARVMALAKIAELERRAAFGGMSDHPNGQRQRTIRSETRTVILAEENCPPAELAFLYGITEEHVKRVRREAGRDPETGERLSADQRALTEPARDTMRRRASASA